MRARRAIGAVAMASAVLASSRPARAIGPNATVLVSRPSGAGAPPAPGANAAALGRNALSGDGRFVVFTSGADDLGVRDTLVHVWVRDTVADTVTLVDRVAPGGAPGNGRAREASISRDGTTVCFVGDATNLVPGVSGTHVFVVALASGAIAVADRATGPDGVPGNDAPLRCALDAGGTRVVFNSGAGNLVPGDTNTTTDVFVRDLVTTVTTRVSVDAAGVQAPNGGRGGVIDASGMRVAFSSDDALLPADTNGREDVYVRDLEDDSLVLASLGTGGVLANGDSFAPAIDDAGTHVAFTSAATNLAPGAHTNNSLDVFWRDLGADTTVAVSRAPGATGALGDGDSRAPAISGDGLGVAFESVATNLAEGVPAGRAQVYLRRLGPDDTSLLSRATGAAGAPAAGASAVSLASAPTTAAWAGLGAALHPDASDDFQDVFTRTLAPSETTALVSRPPGTAPRARGVHDAFVRPRGMSADGRLVAFLSQADGIDPAAAGPNLQLFVRDVETDTTTLVSRGPGPDGPAADGASGGYAVAAGGAHVAFFSRATNLLDSVTTPQVYLRALATGDLRVASRADESNVLALGVDANTVDVSADGTRVAFAATGRLVPADGNFGSDVYVRDLAAGRTLLVSVAADGTAAGGSLEPSLSDDGRRVAFASSARDLLDGAPPSAGFHVYVRDLEAETTVRADVHADGSPGPGQARVPELSGAGNRVVFHATKALTAESVSAGGALYVRDVDGQTTLLVSRGDGPSGPAASVVTRSAAPSHDGSRVAFAAAGPELPTAPPAPQVFVRDLAAGTTVLASLADGTAATAANGPAESVALDAGGGCLAFDSTADNLADPGYPTRDFSQAYVRVLGDACPSRTPATTTSTTLPPAPGAPLAAKTLVVRPGRLVKLVARGDFPPPDDPQIAGATLEVAGTTGAAAWTLPASGWKRVGRRASKGFRFRGEACRGAFGRRRVVVTCRGATGGLALPEPGPVRVTLALGPQAYCAECGGKPAGKPARVFKRRRCAAPAACPG